MNANPQTRAGFYGAVLATLLALVVIGLGVFTRLVDAGLGCPDWPSCYGHLWWPDEANEIALAHKNFPDAAPVDVTKTWPEMLHRYLAGILVLLVGYLAVVGFIHRHEPDYPWRLSLLNSVLVLWQAVFGIWTVTMKLLPQVVSMHLLGGMATFSLLLVLSLRLSSWRWYSHSAEQRLWLPSRLLWVGLCLAVLQAFLGGWMSANYAAFGCIELPTCLNGQWLPKVDFAAGFNFFQQEGPNYLGGLLKQEARTAIHLSHRLGALILTLYLLWMALKLWQLQFTPLRHIIKLMLATLLALLLLGLSNVYFVLPLAIAIAHNVFANLLIACIVTMLTHVYLVRKG